ncbi:hypothetical protein F3C99_03805 [Vitellibacter sp. q18]|jgi:hypothetical protein|nr:hypothetical protein [Aequorivita lutea]
MSTLVSYLLAAILQFIGVIMPSDREPVSALTHQQCEESADVHPYSFIINSEQKLETSKKQL